jgi:hypothetical protein
MSLIVEDGRGLSTAESYASVAYATARHAALGNDTWATITTTQMEQALRRATIYIDAKWGAAFRGVRRGDVQALLFPRTDALDDAGYPLPDLPPELPAATADMALKAAAGDLAPEIKAGGRIIEQVKAGSVEVRYGNTGQVETTYPAIERMLLPLLNPNGAWAFGVAGKR